MIYRWDFFKKPGPMPGDIFEIGKKKYKVVKIIKYPKNTVSRYGLVKIKKVIQ